MCDVCVRDASRVVLRNMILLLAGVYMCVCVCVLMCLYACVCVCVDVRVYLCWCVYMMDAFSYDKEKTRDFFAKLI